MPVPMTMPTPNPMRSSGAEAALEADAARAAAVPVLVTTLGEDVLHGFGAQDRVVAHGRRIAAGPGRPPGTARRGGRRQA